MTTLAIDTCKDCDVEVYDVPGAFLQSDIPNDRKLLMIIINNFVDIMCEVNPEFKKHV